MCIYIVHNNKQKAEDIARQLDEDVTDIKIYCSSYEAIEEIRACGKPCLVILHESRIAVNGEDFMTIAKRHTPYIDFIIISDKNDSENLKTALGFIEEENIFRQNTFCKGMGDTITSCYKRVSIIETLQEEIKDLRSRVANLSTKVVL